MKRAGNGETRAAEDLVRLIEELERDGTTVMELVRGGRSQEPWVLFVNLMFRVFLPEIEWLQDEKAKAPKPIGSLIRTRTRSRIACWKC